MEWCHLVQIICRIRKEYIYTESESIEFRCNDL